MAQGPPIACLRYARADQAITFLCDAFGFSRHAVHVDDADPTIIHHAQLTYGGGMIMLSSDRGGEIKALYRWKTPAEAGGVTMCLCVVVDDPDAHFEHARAAGAEIIRMPYDNDGYPGRSYDARDPEGNVWNFTGYDPWAN